jgi:acetyl-CoA carboxylase biotin carboxyl carrier protein
MKKTEHRTKPAAPPPVGAGEFMSHDEIKELIGLVAEKQFTEFELVRGDFRLRLQRGSPRPSADAGHPPVTNAAPESVAIEPEAAPTAAPEEQLHFITSPIVGTFFRSPSPTAEPFVNPGDYVKTGATLCIIEAMKLMNEIQSDVHGTIVSVLAESGQPVEYGQRLFGIKV